MFCRPALPIGSGRVAALACVLAAAGAAAIAPATALAKPTGLCINTAKAAHVIFGPNSFFEPSATQGPTSFGENEAQSESEYPLYRGTSAGKPVQYVITDASNLTVARELGVNYAPKLAAAASSSGVQKSASRIGNGNGINFPATVNFSASRVLKANPKTGFPPLAAKPGPVGNSGYSPLVQVLVDGIRVVLNAPQLANSTGQHPKVTTTITGSSTNVKLSETFGCFDDLSVHYVSFDASNETAAAIENVTYAPAMAAVPSPNCADVAPATGAAGAAEPLATESSGCARESLAAFTNGITPLSNNQWQGLNNSLGFLFCNENATTHECENNGFEISPFNILKGVPNPTQQFQYSPMWDTHLAEWTSESVNEGLRARIGNFQDIVQIAAMGYLTGPEGKPFGSSFAINCPPVSLDVPAADVPTS
ncbi:MAG TPA: hypothetical protein VGX51_08365 [Solirubrobacteraceae bacterium]|jgi:hypothetical protein|nr:hypothetical protein [Solirubrobacteraceae bacterium]